ncbi:MAG: ABC transporter ATP-binding protein [Magnetococcales bacterium]|nr:ABC transporter ATP-binding protein [Magnetococcales bacterium]
MTSPISHVTEETQYGATFDWRLVRRFLLLAKPYRKWLLAAFAMPPLLMLSQLAQPLLLRQAVDKHLLTGQLEGFHTIVIAYAFCLVGQTLFSYLQYLFNTLLGQRIIRDLRRQLFTHLLSLDAAFFATNPSGRLTNRLTNDTEAVHQMVSAGMVNLIGDLLLILGMAVSMLLLAPGLTLATLAAIPPIVLTSNFVMRRLRTAQRQNAIQQSRMASRLSEEIEGHLVVRLFSRQAHNHREFSRENEAYYQSATTSNFWEAFQISFMEAAASLLIALLFVLGGSVQGSEAITIGTLVAFIDYIRRIFSPIRDLSNKLTTLQAAMTALERIFHLQDTQPAIQSAPPETQPSTPTGKRGAVVFDNVSFGYGPELVLHDIGLRVAAGEKLAVVGPTGSGKSSLIKLLNRTHDPRSGRVILDGVDVSHIPLSRLRRLVGMVQQDTFLFAGSIAENIGLGAEGIDRKKIEEAVERSGAIDFIRHLPHGLDTTLHQRGGNLSAGQRQLLGLTRIFAFDPAIMVLDEATSSVDTISEELIRKALHALLANRTAILVAHRLSTIGDADRIVVLSRGRVAEEGTFAELMAANGLFSRLYTLQFQNGTHIPA